jgi:hypothetical protein
MARYALDDRRVEKEMKQSQEKASAEKAAIAIKRQLSPLEGAVQGVFAISE